MKVQPEPARTEKLVVDLTRGTWVEVIDEEGRQFGEAEVLHVERFDQYAMLLYRPLGSDPASLIVGDACTMPLLSDDQAKHASEREARLRLAEDLRNLAQKIVHHQLPLPGDLRLSVDLGRRAAVAAVAEALDVPTRPFVKTGLQAEWPKGRRAYDDGLTFMVYTTEEEPEPVDEQVRGASEEHFQVRGWGTGGTGTAGVECKCGVTYDGFDSLAEARAQLKLHIADPDGFDRSRADEDDEPVQQIGKRVEPHAGDAVSGIHERDGHYDREPVITGQVELTAAGLTPEADQRRGPLAGTTPVVTYFSFGHGQTDPDSGQSLLDHYVTVVAPTYEQCREAMFASRFGRAWSFDYLAGTARATEWIPRWTEHEVIVAPGTDKVDAEVAVALALDALLGAKS